MKSFLLYFFFLNSPTLGNQIRPLSVSVSLSREFQEKKMHYCVPYSHLSDDITLHKWNFSVF
jgi:hypothetical protein